MTEFVTGSKKEQEATHNIVLPWFVLLPMT